VCIVAAAVGKKAQGFNFCIVLAEEIEHRLVFFIHAMEPVKHG